MRLSELKELRPDVYEVFYKEIEKLEGAERLKYCIEDDFDTLKEARRFFNKELKYYTGEKMHFDKSLFKIIDEVNSIDGEC